MLIPDTIELALPNKFARMSQIQQRLEAIDFDVQQHWDRLIPLAINQVGAAARQGFKGYDVAGGNIAPARHETDVQQQRDKTVYAEKKAPKIDDSTEDEFLTIDEAAALLRVHPRTIAKLARNGKLPYLRLGNLWRFCRSSVLNLVKERNRAIAPAAKVNLTATNGVRNI